ncbi:MAG: hypothetical protein C0485_02220 [Pirellula sp.]|nr:hypothetical protein [Pirellula sp.]
MINLHRHFRAANHPGRAPRTAIAPLAFLADGRQPTADSRRYAARRGISLLEVLISMFVLLFGLMGVASIFPVGNHYAGKGEQFDRGSALAESAFADLKARGMLEPEHWYYANHPVADAQIVPATGTSTQPPSPSPVLQPAPFSDFNVPLSTANNTGPGYAFVIDPMGAALGIYGPQGNYNPTTAIAANLDYFPYASLVGASTPDGAPNTLMPNGWQQNLPAKAGLIGNRWPLRRVSLQQSANWLLTPRVAETIFRLHDDVTNELPKENDRPGIQRWTAVDSRGGTPNNTPNDPSDDTLLARSYTGNYSWLATVVPTSADSLAALQPLNSRFGSDLYEVSVAVFNKREPLPPSAATERLIEAQMLQGNELVIYGTNSDPNLAIENVDNAAEGIRAGNWIAVAGVHPTTGAFLLKWYRILSIDNETQENQQILNATGSLTGNYPVRRAMLDGPDWPLADLGSGVRADITPRAILLPGVISVATQMLPMESAQ